MCGDGSVTIGRDFDFAVSLERLSNAGESIRLRVSDFGLIKVFSKALAQ